MKKLTMILAAMSIMGVMMTGCTSDTTEGTDDATNPCVDNPCADADGGDDMGGDDAATDDADGGEEGGGEEGGD